MSNEVAVGRSVEPADTCGNGHRACISAHPMAVEHLFFGY